MAVLEPLVAELPPITVDASGTARVGGTRVTLDTLVFEFNAGRTAGEIQDSYDTLRLTDIYAAIAYYLKHREAVDAYLEQRRRDAEQLRREIEQRFPPDPRFRERPLAAQAEKREEQASE